MRSLKILVLAFFFVSLSCIQGWAAPFGKREPVTIDHSQLGPNKLVELNLHGNPVKILGKRLDKRGEGRSTWIGNVQGGDKFDQAIITTERGHVAGNVAYRGKKYHLHSDEWGIVHATEVHEAEFPTEMEPIPVELEDTAEDVMGASSATLDTMAADDATIIDVMIVYTPKVAASATNLSAQLQLAVDETNQTYANSGVKQRVRLVHAAQVSYTESGNISTDLSRLRNETDGYLDTIHSLRDQYGADLVSLWVEGGSACGVAYVMKSVSTSFESYGFSVIRRDCATGYYSQGHELGHNMGSMHDIYVSPDNGAYSYSHGHADPQGRFRTVMAYNNACSAQGTSCTRIPYWSNPDVNYNNRTTGDDAMANNKMSLDFTANAVANFRASKSSPTPTDPTTPTEPTDPTTSTPTVQLPDLTGTWSKFSVSYGRTFYTTLRVSNVGQSTSGSFNVSYYRSTDGKALTQRLRTVSISGVKNGSSVSLNYNFSFSSSIRGQYIIAVVDAGNSVTESDENNNRTVRQVN